MIACYIEGVGLCGPGLAGWVPSMPILAGAEPYAAMPTQVPPSPLLPANERRRAAQIVKMALAVGMEAFVGSAWDPADTASVFAASGGDGDTIHEILNTLASPERELSPIRFHNSVHNASAGYWSIATRSRAASTSLCGHDDTFPAGLLEATVQSVSDQQPVILIAYDVLYPWPLSGVRTVGANFGVALLLAPEATPASLAHLDLAVEPGAAAPTKIGQPELEILRGNTPSARSLPLLAALACGRASTVTLSYLDNLALTLNITPIPRIAA